MINENEIHISNKSYINKDFASIYPELLDLAKKMSRRWDPETSNESDPGIVLLKLLGFVGDKLNYNVDKNVLECFMPSCTQESSMRKLCDMLGYEMGYYIAPEAQVTFSYSGDEEKWPEGVTFPALSTSVSDDGESVFYVLTEGLSMPVKGDREPRSAPAIQGTVSTLSAGDSQTIGLENLDDNNRVYFPVTGVAQNGVFVSNVNTDGTVPTSGFWRRSVNLNVEQVGSKVFKFGYDSSRSLPYIEFPDDIASLIDDGLLIRYVVTDGVSGAVSAGMLTRLSSPKEATVGEKTYSFVTDPDEASSDSPVNLVVNNPSASTAGANPETIDEAYNSFKRRIGTFDTLVTCRDYANFIYNMELSGQPVVSNVQAARRLQRPGLGQAGRHQPLVARRDAHPHRAGDGQRQHREPVVRRRRECAGRQHALPLPFPALRIQHGGGVRRFLPLAGLHPAPRGGAGGGNVRHGLPRLRGLRELVHQPQQRHRRGQELHDPRGQTHHDL